ncbi:RNA-binding S4 domain-containing protein [Albirhodobacter sp. R86504]|jgi:ribosome-associated heat shock protein Hsp15|uniref:RNA-binding S4 domain-containing protein n=1 Tax=Albirhodobacter sp. R86504 TaxID=3093848 RepID=UPI003672DFFD
MRERLRNRKAAPKSGAAFYMPDTEAERIRLDKWLFFARFFKSRGLAAGAISANAVRVNGAHAGRASKMVGAGDVLTFVMGGDVRVVKLLACGARRGAPSEAQKLYEWLSDAPSDWGRAAWEDTD